MGNEFFEKYCKENVIVNFEGDIHVFTEGVGVYKLVRNFRERKERV